MPETLDIIEAENKFVSCLDIFKKKISAEKSACTEYNNFGISFSCTCDNNNCLHDIIIAWLKETRLFTVTQLKITTSSIHRNNLLKVCLWCCVIFSLGTLITSGSGCMRLRPGYIRYAFKDQPYFWNTEGYKWKCWPLP